MSSSFETLLKEEDFICFIKGQPFVTDLSQFIDDRKKYIKVSISLSEYNVECVFPEGSSSPTPSYKITPR